MSVQHKALDGDECSAYGPGRVTPRKETRNPLNRKVGGPMGQSGHFAEENNSWSLPGCPASSAVTVPANLYRLQTSGNTTSNSTHFHRYYSGNQIKKNYMGRACDMCVGGDRCTVGYGGKLERLVRPRRGWEDNTKMDRQ
jgi:hypothetical protein